MSEQFFLGIKNGWTQLLKRVVVVTIGWMIISSILINVLFSYFKYYVYKEDAKVFYEISSSASEIKNREYTEYRIYTQEIK